MPEGYEIIDGVLQVTLEDELAPIDLELLKIDSMNSRRLEGAEFSIEKQNSAGEYEIIEEAWHQIQTILPYSMLQTCWKGLSDQGSEVT